MTLSQYESESPGADTLFVQFETYLPVCLFVCFFSAVYLHCCLFEICATDSDIDLSFIYSVALSCVVNVPAEENRNKNDLHLRSWQLWDYVDG